jgi:hypothetical protein
MAASRHELDEANRLLANQTHNTMENFESFTIYPMPRERYAEVKAVLIENGYKLVGSEWEKGDDCITTTSYAGEFMTHKKDCFPREQTYTVDEFLSKYGSLTKPLTIGEIHQLRELLKAHSPKPEPKPEPKAETYEGVFSFDSDGGNCNYGKQRLYFSKFDMVWGVVSSGIIEPHILVESPHEVGNFYLLAKGFDPEDPANYGLYDGEAFWCWNGGGEIVKTTEATNFKVVKA